MHSYFQMRCSNLAACTSVDFNRVENTCWLFFTNVESTLSFSSYFDHYEKISCPTTTLPPTIPCTFKSFYLIIMLPILYQVNNSLDRGARGSQRFYLRGDNCYLWFFCSCTGSTNFEALFLEH